MPQAMDDSFFKRAFKGKRILKGNCLQTTVSGYDIDGDGKVSIREFKRIMMKTGKVDPDEIEKMIEKADVDSDGFIDFEEFKKMLSK